MQGFRTWVSGPRREVSGPGSQDLGFRPSTRGFRTWFSGPGFQALDARFQDLALRTWVSGPRKLSILRSSYFFLVTFLCVQWSQTDKRTDLPRLDLWTHHFRSHTQSFSLSRALVAWFFRDLSCARCLVLSGFLVPSLPGFQIRLSEPNLIFRIRLSGPVPPMD